MYQEHLLGLFWGTPWTYFSTVISHLGKTTAIFQIVQSGHNYLCESHDFCSAAHCPSTPPAMLKTLWWYTYRYKTCNSMKTLIMYTKIWWHYEILWCKICKYILQIQILNLGHYFVDDSLVLKLKSESIFDNNPKMSMLSWEKDIIVQIINFIIFLLFFISLFIRKQSISFQSNLVISEQQSSAVINKLNHLEFSPAGNMNDVPFKMIWSLGQSSYVSVQINFFQYEIVLVNKRWSS